MDAEAIAVASLGQMKVIKVNYRGGGPSIAGNEDIVAVYRELLKTYKPESIGMCARWRKPPSCGFRGRNCRFQARSGWGPAPAGRIRAMHDTR